MRLILRIAWRNLFRHRGKSLVIGAILFAGALVMTVGNGVIAGMERGLEKNVVEGFTGDLVVISAKQESDNVLLTLMGKAIEPIHNFPRIREVLDREGYVARFLPAGRNMALVLNEEEGGAPGFAFLLGVDFERYREMFPGTLDTIEGRLLRRGERGVLVPTGSRKELYSMMGLWFAPADEPFRAANFLAETGEAEAPEDLKVKRSMVFLGFNERNTTMDVRLDVAGVVKFKALNTIFGHYNLVDIESYRQCLGYFPAASRSAEIPAAKKALLGMGSEDVDALFGEQPLLVSAPEPAAAATPAAPSPAGAPAETRADIEAGTYNLVFVKLGDGVSPREGLARLNAALGDAQVGARAVTWRKAFGPIGSMATIIKGALFLFVALLFVVAVIIIVNTLTMAALERVPEIGMMRAVGARRGFVSGMFLAETGFLSLVFGGAGIAVGIVAVRVIPLLRIGTSNDLVQLLYGGDTFAPVLHAPDILLTLAQLAGVTLLAVVYPVKVAKGIRPLDAVTRD